MTRPVTRAGVSVSGSAMLVSRRRRMRRRCGERIAERGTGDPAVALAYPLTRIATAARMNATPVMSLRASPAWNSTSDWEPRAIEAPISACGASPYGRPMHQAASSATASQPRLITGETRSRSKKSSGTACTTSELAG